MMKRMFFGWMIGTAVLSALVLFGNVAPAAEFSADIIQKQVGITTKGKVYIKGNKMRMEMETPAGKSVNLMDTETGLMQMLHPAQKMYFEMQAPEAGVVQTDEALAKIADKKPVGTEKVNGHKCDKYEIIYHDRSLGKTTQWFSKRLNYPIKTVYKGPQGEMVMEFKNIKEGRLDSSLFKIPSDYHQMKMPGMGRPSY